MSLLLDTHIFLWYISGDAQLPESTRDAIRNHDDDVYLSVASIWEAVIKHGLGKLPLPGPPADYLPAQRAAHRIVSLPIEEDTFRHLANLPPLHRDPFDRIIISQALQHDLTLVSVDRAVREYGVKLLPPD